MESSRTSKKSYSSGSEYGAGHTACTYRYSADTNRYSIASTFNKPTSFPNIIVHGRKYFQSCMLANPGSRILYVHTFVWSVTRLLLLGLQLIDSA
jgi:hypothetical protein